MKGKILVVEDEPIIRELIQTTLELDGCEVWEAGSASALSWPPSSHSSGCG